MSWWEIDLFWPLFLVSQLSGIAVVVIIGYLIQSYGVYRFSWNDGPSLAFHPSLFTLGMVFFFGEAMLAFPVPRRLNIKSRNVRQVIHGVLQGLAVIFSIVGLRAVFLGKDVAGHLEFYSMHSWLGMASAMLFFLQYGFAMVFYTVSYLTGTKVFSARFKILVTTLHKFFGVVLFAMAIASCVSGMDVWLHLFVPDFSEVIVIPTRYGHFYTLLILLFGVIVAFLATRPPPRSSKRKAKITKGDVEKGKSTKPKDHELTSHYNEAVVEDEQIPA